MLILAVGSSDVRLVHQPLVRGFTLLELLVVLAIVGFASAGVGFSMRDGTQSRLEREAIRLSALFESARARSQISGVPVRWRITAQGFRFEGLPPADQAQDDLSQAWLDSDTLASVDRHADTLLLGPEPIIEPQALTLMSRSQPGHLLHLSTDGVRPFAVPVLP